jgi:hypothetical protein
MDVTLLSPLAGLVGAASEIVPVLRHWRRGEDDVPGAVRSTGRAALLMLLSVAAMVTPASAVAFAALLGAATAADAAR